MYSGFGGMESHLRYPNKIVEKQTCKQCVPMAADSTKGTSPHQIILGQRNQRRAHAGFLETPALC